MADNPNSNAAGATPATGATPGNAATTSNPGATGATPAAGATPQQDQLNFETWLAGQAEPIRTLIDGRFSTLETTLQTERAERKELAKQLKKLTGDLDANSDAAKQLGDISGKLEAAQKRADFYESATAAGCTNLKLAFLAATADNLSIDQVKAQYPQLFAAAKPPATHAGNGTNAGGQGSAASMNNFIRQAAGIRT